MPVEEGPAHEQGAACVVVEGGEHARVLEGARPHELLDRDLGEERAVALAVEEGQHGIRAIEVEDAEVALAARAARDRQRLGGEQARAVGTEQARAHPGQVTHPVPAADDQTGTRGHAGLQVDADRLRQRGDAREPDHVPALELDLASRERGGRHLLDLEVARQAIRLGGAQGEHQEARLVVEQPVGRAAVDHEDANGVGDDEDGGAHVVGGKAIPVRRRHEGVGARLAEGVGEAGLRAALRIEVHPLARETVPIDLEAHAHRDPRGAGQVAELHQHLRGLARAERPRGHRDRGDGGVVGAHLAAGRVLQRDRDAELLQRVQHVEEVLPRGSLAAEEQVLLEVREHAHLGPARALLTGALLHDAEDLGQSRRQVGPLVRRPRQRREDEGCLLGRGPRDQPGGGPHEEHVQAVAGASVQLSCQLHGAATESGEGGLGPDGQASGGGAVEEDDDVPPLLGQDPERAARGRERPRDGEGQQGDRSHAQEQQQQVLELDAPTGPSVGGQDEAHGRPGGGPVALAIEQVDHQRHGRQGSAGCQSRVEEALDHPRPPPRARALRWARYVRITSSRGWSVLMGTRSTLRPAAARTSSRLWASISSR